MRLRRYCVTVMDNWTPMRYFWTFRGAFAFYLKHYQFAHIWQWYGEAQQRGGSQWREMRSPQRFKPGVQ